MAKIRGYLQDQKTGAIIECDPGTGQLILNHVFVPPNGGGYGEIVWDEPDSEGGRLATFKDANKGLACALVGPNDGKLAKLELNPAGQGGDFQRWWVVDQESPKGKYTLTQAFVRFTPPHYGATRPIYLMFTVILVT